MSIRSFALVCLALTACTDDGASERASSTRFFLPTGGVGTNTSPPTIQIDHGGTLHAVYPAYAGGGAFYAECPAQCGDETAMKTVSFDTGHATVDNAMLALDRDGHPAVLLATGAQILYASCTGDCTSQASWTVTPLLDTHGDLDVTGQAFALDPQGRPRFVMHTYIAYLGIGQQPPMTEWVSCDANCTNAASWTRGVISENQIWGHSTLRFDATGRAHLATVALVAGDSGTVHMGAYATCSASCGTGDSWSNVALGTVYSSEYEAVTIDDQIALALTSTGAPRIAYLWSDQGAKKLVYAECAAGDCTADGAWTATSLSDDANLDAGIALALDAADHPRLALALNYNIGLGSCDDAACATASAAWHLTTIEAGSDLPTDQIFLYPNCTVGAWFLHNPSLALAPDGKPRVAYSARDVSGMGIHTTDPNEPACVAGTDMILGRIALVD